METPKPPEPQPRKEFVFSALGPWSDGDQDWCCGLKCGQPCPYGLKIRPKGETRP